MNRNVGQRGEIALKLPKTPMKPAEFWKNFGLGEEVSISGAFIYNGLRRFHELTKLDYADEIFEVLYYLSVGLERLLKIAVVLLEHKDDGDQEALEQSLITHNHLDLLHRIKQHTTVNLSTPHNELLSLLATFYRTLRYDRFSLSSVSDFRKERDALCGFFAKHLQVEFADQNGILGTPNDVYRKFLRKTVQKSRQSCIDRRDAARELNLYTYEAAPRIESQTIFLGEADIPAERLVERITHFLHEHKGYVRVLVSWGIPPLGSIRGLSTSIWTAFSLTRRRLRDELEHHYEQLAG
jgi:hypothetical protein